ncbi:MAG: hypothetical protein AAGF14_01165, partial [Pseudomonadota bacterium]
MSDISASDETLQDRRSHARETADRRAGPRPRLGNFQFSTGDRLISPQVVTGSARLIEFLLIAGFGYGIFFSYIHADAGLTDQAGHILYAIAILIAAAGSILCFQSLRLYDISIFSNLFKQITRIWAGWSLIFAALMSIFFFTKLGQEYSRVWVAGWYVSGLSALIIFRIGICFAVRNWSRLGRLNRRAVIVGGGPSAHKLIKALEASRDTDIRIYGVFDDRDDDRVSDRIAGYPRLG